MAETLPLADMAQVVAVAELVDILATVVVVIPEVVLVGQVQVVEVEVVQVLVAAARDQVEVVV